VIGRFEGIDGRPERWRADVRFNDRQQQRRRFF